MTRLGIADNPAFFNKPVKRLTAICHDRSPYLTVTCPCGCPMHLHETQLDGAPDDADVVTRCHKCGDELELSVAGLRAAFGRMRDQGWIE